MKPLTFDKVLVTGGAGFVGSHTIDALLERGATVWVLDNLSSGFIANLKGWKACSRFHFRKGDVRSYEAVRSISRKVEAVIHLAAIVSPNVSIHRPELTNEVNVAGTLNVLRAAIKCQLQKVVFASSSSVYGNSRMNPVSEDATLNPITPYGVSKLAAEKYCHVFHMTSGLKTVSLRYFNVYGERQSANPYSGVIAIFTGRLLTGKAPIIYGTGTQTRDFVYVGDVANANLQALETNRGLGRPFNIGTGHSTSLRQLSRTLTRLTAQRVNPVFAEARPGDIRCSQADITNAKQILGFHPKVPLIDGLSRLIKSVRSGKE